MRKNFFVIATIINLFVATFFMRISFAAENNEPNNGFDYVSQIYGFKIKCPAKPIVIVNPFEDPKKQGELLVIKVTEDGQDIAFGYQILLDAFDDKSVPNFNKDSKNVIDDYIKKLIEVNRYEHASLENLSKDNKGILAVTSKEIEIKNEKGEKEGVLIADRQSAFTFFRTKNGRCISIQLITNNLNSENMADYIKSVVSFQD